MSFFPDNAKSEISTRKNNYYKEKKFELIFLVKHERASNVKMIRILLKLTKRLTNLNRMLVTGTFEFVHISSKI